MKRHEWWNEIDSLLKEAGGSEDEENLVKLLSKSTGASKERCENRVKRFTERTPNPRTGRFVCTLGTYAPKLTGSRTSSVQQTADEDDDDDTPSVVAEATQTRAATTTAVSTYDMSQYVPQVDIEYFPRKVYEGITDWDIFSAAYFKSKKVLGRRANVLLVGETGTGKTHMARNLAFQLKVPYMRIPLSGGSTVEDLLGQWCQGEEKGKLVWVDGLVTRFVRNGGILVLDEVNGCPNEVKFVLHPLLDDERKVVLTGKDGEVVRAHPDLFVVATMNEGYEGTQDLNLAFGDRWDSVIRMEYSEHVDRKVLGEVPYVNDILEVAKKLRAMKGQELNTPMSTRALKQLSANIELVGVGPAIWQFAQRFPEGERAPVKTVLEAHLLGKR